MALLFRTALSLIFSSIVISLLLRAFASSGEWRGLNLEVVYMGRSFPFVVGISAFGLLAMMPLAIMLVRLNASYEQSLTAFLLAGSLLGFLILWWIVSPTAWGVVAGAATASIWVAMNRCLFRSAPRV